MLYYYAPSFVSTDSEGLESFFPGVINGDTIEAASMPLGSSSPHYDRELPRFVLACPAGTAAQSGWELKTADQVKADYPGVI